ncbi:MAG: hypothetical protein R2991_08095 [Thermoanaerobaculia bacterium]
MTESRRNTRRWTRLALAFLMVGALLPAVGCEKQDDDLGDKIEDVGDEIEDAADEMDDGAEKVGDAVEDAADDAEDAVDGDGGGVQQ